MTTKPIRLAFTGASGCIAGAMHVPYSVYGPDGVRQNSKGGSIETLFHRFHRIRRPGKGNFLRPETGGSRYTVPCMDDDGYVRGATIANVIDSGVRPCVRVTTTGGLSVTCTLDHPFATSAGYRPIAELGVGATVLVHRNVRMTSARQRVIRPEIYVKHHPFASQKTVSVSSGDYRYKRLSRARAVYEAHLNGLSVEKYKARLDAGDLAGLVFLPPGMDVHHKDENPLNDVPENLLALSHVEHASEHDGPRRMAHVAVEDTILSIVEVGAARTYDIRMEQAPHNFVVEGFVVHNTGKSTLATTLAEKLSLPICPTGSREIAKEMGFENPYDVDAAGKRAEFQKRLFARKAAWEHSSVGGFVTDRTYLDNLTYTAMHSTETAADPTFRSMVFQATEIYTHIVFCPIGAFHNLGGDPARVAELEYHHKYECLLMEMLSRHVYHAPILWLTSSDRDTRIAQVERFVRP